MVPLALLLAVAAQSPDPCYCGWTVDYACPSFETPGTGGYASDDGSSCFKYCKSRRRRHCALDSGD